MPRVIAGKYRSIPLEAPKGMLTRPSTDKVKEALFSMLQAVTSFEDKKVLELFAGSGQLSLECLSRGAKEAYLVDKNRQAHLVQKKNIQKLKVESQTHVFCADAHIILEKWLKESQCFDFIFLDPPYAEAEKVLAKSLPKLKALLKDEAYLMFEGPSDIKSFEETFASELNEQFYLWKERDFSACRLSIFRKRETEA